MMISLAFATVLLAAAGAAAEPPTQPQASTPTPASAPTTVEAAVVTATAKKKPEPTEMVCKREAVLGSRMKKRNCQTFADWEERKTSARADVEWAQTNQPRPR